MSNNDNNAIDEVSDASCDVGDCGKGDCEKCQEEVTPESKSMEECMGKSMEMLANTFSASAKRWEMIVYPSLFAFILLAGYGFYLIYSLTQDAHEMMISMKAVSNNMVVISESMLVISKNTDNQTIAMRDMAANMHGMNGSMNQMRQDMSVLNHSISRPMNKMNSFMPW
ncbi:MAG: hypothetical protein KAT25_02060 [Sulfuriflexus sp.]|nr:hypothetical protein [Sulfuriflexus sp.]